MDIDEIQFGFMPECSTTNGIFIQSHYWRNIQPYFAFVDLEKAFNQVPRDIVEELPRNQTEQCFAKILQSMYKNA